MAILEEIAAAAGVSRSTVSRVINHEPRVSDETRQRVWGVIREFDFQPNTAVRALAGHRSYMVGLVIQRPLTRWGADLYFSRLMHSVAAACEEHGYHLMLSLVPSQTTDAYSRIIRGGRLDGLLDYYSCVENPFVERLHEEKLPFVLMGRHLTRTDIPSVDADNVHGATLAAQHLASLGYRHIATITGPLHAVSSIDRREGFLAGLCSYGLRCLPDHIVEGDFTEQGGYRAMAQLLQTEHYCQTHQRFARCQVSLVALAQTTPTVQPAERALNDPSLVRHLELMRPITAPDDFQHPAKYPPHPVNQLTCVPPICPDRLQTWKQLFALRQKQTRPIAILNIRRQHQHKQHQTQSVYQIWRLTPLIFFPAS